ncbi:MAG TPA: FmdE family protein, partial [Bacteroidales bacterium]|nr:FmdE family protein [Bacteroidales bacterium]
TIKTEQASLITKQIRYLSMQSNISHLQCWDELCAAYIANPRIFTFKERIENPYIQEIYNYEVEPVKSTLINILNGKCKQESGVIFAQFPIDSTYIQDDVLEIKDQVIQKYGLNEFKAAVLTSEIHNHLGIYSILGAKMGIKAIELLNAPNSSISIQSFAGNMPPLSCLNDGIMVSTGSTPAYNLFKIDTSSLYPSAIFCYKNKCMQLSLKKEIYERISKDLNDAVLTFSLGNDAYWNYVRKRAIIEWLNLNRDEIFDIKEVNK